MIDLIKSLILTHIMLQHGDGLMHANLVSKLYLGTRTLFYDWFGILHELTCCNLLSDNLLLSFKPMNTSLVLHLLGLEKR